MALCSFHKDAPGTHNQATNPYQEALDETTPVAPAIGPFLLLLSIWGKCIHIHIHIQAEQITVQLTVVYLYTQGHILISRVSRVCNTGNGCVYKPFVRPHPDRIKMPGLWMAVVICSCLSRNSHPGKCGSLGFLRLSKAEPEVSLDDSGNRKWRGLAVAWLGGTGGTGGHVLCTSFHFSF